MILAAFGNRNSPARRWASAGCRKRKVSAGRKEDRRAGRGLDGPARQSAARQVHARRARQHQRPADGYPIPGAV